MLSSFIKRITLASAFMLVVLGLCISSSVSLMFSPSAFALEKNGELGETSLAQQVSYSAENTLHPQTKESGYTWPLVVRGINEDNFSPSHGGIDIEADKGTHVVASMDGYVRFIQSYPHNNFYEGPAAYSWGNLVVLYHPKTNMSTYYAHLDSSCVTLGQEVSAGEVIGTVGETGEAYAPHLHFEMRTGGNPSIQEGEYAGNDGIRVNPMDYVDPDDVGKTYNDDNGYRNGVQTTVSTGVAYTLVSVLDLDRAVDVADGSSASGANVRLWWRNQATAQQFIFSEAENGAYYITNVCSNTVLDVESGSSQSGANIFMWPQEAQQGQWPSQHWYVEDCGQGIYSFRNAASNLYLDLAGGVTSLATNIRQWPGNGTDAQKFYLVPATSSPSIPTLKLSGLAEDCRLIAGASEPHPDVCYLSKSDQELRVPALYSGEKPVESPVAFCSVKPDRTYVVEIDAITRTSGEQHHIQMVARNTSGAECSNRATFALTNQTQVRTIRSTAAGILFIYPADFQDLASASTWFTGVRVYEVLDPQTDYVLSYHENLCPGQASLVVTGKGDFVSAGSISHTFRAVDTWERIAGDSRYETARATTQAGFPGGNCDRLLLATGENYADALAASALAGLWECPLVMIPPEGLTVPVEDEIMRLASFGAELFIVGGENSVSYAVEDRLLDYAATGAFSRVQRIAGEDRIDTAHALYRAGAGAWGHTALIADAWNFPDALAIGPYAAAAQAPLFTTSDGVLQDESIHALQAGGFTQVVVVGGPQSVDFAAIKNALGDGVELLHLVGTTRLETSAAIAAWVCGQYEDAAFQPDVTFNCDSKGVATAWNFPDALSAVNVLGQNKIPLLLVNGSDVEANSTLKMLADNLVLLKNGYIFGGCKSVSTEVEDWLVSLSHHCSSSDE